MIEDYVTQMVRECLFRKYMSQMMTPMYGQAILPDLSAQLSQTLKQRTVESLPQQTDFNSYNISQDKQATIKKEGQLGLLSQRRELIESKLTNLIENSFPETPVPDPGLQKVFDMLEKKYIYQRKSKEEIIKYVMRKAFKFFSKSIQSKSDQDLTLVQAQQQCLNHYFQNDNTILPFRKNSQIRTMNLKFMEKMFTSEKFIHDYRVFLEHFDAIMESDNRRKLTNTCNKIYRLLNDNQLNNISTLRRMPWTKRDLEEAKKVSMQMIETYRSQKP